MFFLQQSYTRDFFNSFKSLDANIMYTNIRLACQSKNQIPCKLVQPRLVLLGDRALDLKKPSSFELEWTQLDALAV